MQSFRQTWFGLFDSSFHKLRRNSNLMYQPLPICTYIVKHALIDHVKDTKNELTSLYYFYFHYLLVVVFFGDWCTKVKEMYLINVSTVFSGKSSHKMYRTTHERNTRGCPKGKRVQPQHSRMYYDLDRKIRSGGVILEGIFYHCGQIYQR